MWSVQARLAHGCRQACCETDVLTAAAPAVLGVQACGFQLVFEDAAAPQGAPAPAAPGVPDGSGVPDRSGAAAADAPSPEPPTEAFAELPSDADLAPLRQALQLLAPPAPVAPHQPLPSPPRASPAPCGERAAERPASGELANGAAAGGAAADSAQPRPRNTQARALGSAGWLLLHIQHVLAQATSAASASLFARQGFSCPHLFMARFLCSRRGCAGQAMRECMLTTAS